MKGFIGKKSLQMILIAFILITIRFVCMPPTNVGSGILNAVLPVGSAIFLVNMVLGNLKEEHKTARQVIFAFFIGMEVILPVVGNTLRQNGYVLEWLVMLVVVVATFIFKRAVEKKPEELKGSVLILALLSFAFFRISGAWLSKPIVSIVYVILGVIAAVGVYILDKQDKVQKHNKRV